MLLSVVTPMLSANTSRYTPQAWSHMSLCRAYAGHQDTRAFSVSHTAVSEISGR